MRDDVPAPVGHDGGQVGNLERRHPHFTLSDGDGFDGGEFPSAQPGRITLVIEFGRRQGAPQFGGEIAAQGVSEAKTLHILVPFVQGRANRGIFPVLQHVPQRKGKIGIARHHDGLFQVQGRFVAVAARTMVAQRISVGAGEHHLRPERPLLQADQPVHQFEHRSGRIGRLNGPVEHGFIRIGRDFFVMTADIGQHVHIDTGTGHHGQDFPRGRFNGHQRAHLVLHQQLSVLLEIGIDRGHDIPAGNGLLVHFPVAVVIFNLVMGVPQVNVIPFLAPQVLFAGRFDAGLAGIIPAAILVRMRFQKGGIHLGNITQQVPARIYRIVPDASGLPLEARELVFQFIEPHEGFRWNLLQQHHALPADLAAEAFVFGHLLADKIRLDPQGRCQQQGVERLHLARRAQDIIGHLVAHDNLAVPVINDAPGRIDDIIDHRVVLRAGLVFVVQDLDGEQLYQ